ncbi:hypothetical protein V6N13_052546 [Hibiscus sabdariffa]|uniref:Uncharacterized protein n=1 Tax=Hibiscus sabdariffa TaxID=183260 RepID=A0ABR2Q4N1_9ROSI
MKSGFVDISLLMRDVENLDHLFRWCPSAHAAWLSLVKPDCLIEFFELEFAAWLERNILHPEYFARAETDWSVLFGAVLWSIWLHRNKRIFDPSDIDKEPIVVHARRLTTETTAAVMMKPCFMGRFTTSEHQVSVNFPLDAGCLVLHTDYAVNTLNGTASCLTVVLWSLYSQSMHRWMRV